MSRPASFRKGKRTVTRNSSKSWSEQAIAHLKSAHEIVTCENERYRLAIGTQVKKAREDEMREKRIAALKADADERTKEVKALKACFENAERTATGFQGDGEIPPIPYSLEPPKQPMSCNNIGSPDRE